jgi:hypothetical protein
MLRLPIQVRPIVLTHDQCVKYRLPPREGLRSEISEVEQPADLPTRRLGDDESVRSRRESLPLRLSLMKVGARKVRFAADSPLEGNGFELPIPRE